MGITRKLCMINREKLDVQLRNVAIRYMHIATMMVHRKMSIFLIHPAIRVRDAVKTAVKMVYVRALNFAKTMVNWILGLVHAIVQVMQPEVNVKFWFATNLTKYAKLESFQDFF